MNTTEFDDVIADLVHMLAEESLAEPDSLVGCSAEEIAQLEDACGVHLPATYRAFLARMGRNAGGFLRGSDFLYPDLLKLRAWAEDVLAANGGPFALRPEDFVFLMHQGYQFCWFATGTSASDPPVYFYTEVDGDRPALRAPLQAAASVSTFLIEWARADGSIRRRLRQFREATRAGGVARPG